MASESSSPSSQVLWPPPGSTLRTCLIREVVDTNGIRTSILASGDALETVHAHGLIWLLDEHERGKLAEGALTVDIELQIATTRMPGGRVGHAYALDGGALGAPGADQARGVLWRFLQDAIADLAK